MKNQKLYRAIINNSEGLEALQNNNILPKGFVPYSMALEVVEEHEFHTFLLEGDFEKFRIKIDQERLFQYESYLRRCKLDRPLGDAEKTRQEARNVFNEAIYKGFIKSVIFKFDKDQSLKTKPEPLPESFWQSHKSFRIDGLSFYFEKKKEIFTSKGLIALDRPSLEKWGAAYPNEPNMVGRKKGAGKIDDDESLAFMRSVITKDKMSPNKAAGLAVDKFSRKGASIKADIDRLGRKYSKQFPN
jgi:hypothetical protein